VAVTLTSGSSGHTRDQYRLRIETTDIEELNYQYTVPVPARAAGVRFTVQGYIVPGGDGVNFGVRLETASGQVLQSLTKINRDASREEVVTNEEVLILTAGSTLSALRRSAEKFNKPPEKAKEGPVYGRRQFVSLDDASQLPDRWFGYDAVDVFVLTSGNRDLITQLEQDSDDSRRTALLTWVRRGGQLVLSVGRNQQDVARLLKKLPLINVEITGTRKIERLPTVSQWSTPELRDVLAQVETATVVPGQGTTVLLTEDRQPLIMQASCGLGRVVLVACDVDAPPFTTWNGRQDFWTKMQEQVAPYVAPRLDRQIKPQQRGAPGMPGMQVDDLGTDSRVDLRGALKRNLEQFEDVPTISFGWVALFILFYIVLVGPLDYFVLKKLFKKLELTWITFPLTVIVVSVVAYVVAFRIKGDQVRINKIDLVEIDLHQPRQVYGQSIFTLFSPRVQSYTIGIEPDASNWTDVAPEGAIPPLETLLEGGDRPVGPRTQSLFPRPYEYAPDAAGLLRVPVAVWSTRSFRANWQAPVREKAPPIQIATPDGALRRRPDDSLVGKLVNNLPFELRDVSLFYRQHLYTIKSLAPNGGTEEIEKLFMANAEGQKRELTPWFSDDTLAPGRPLSPSGRAINSAFARNRQDYLLLKPTLFFRESSKENTSNAGLRLLDQSWRLKPQEELPTRRQHNRDEVILVARAAMLVDEAEVVTSNPISPTRLWLGKLPASGEERPPVPGFITQETYVRVYIPVKQVGQ
jgi:hypothetical protein